MADLLAAVAVPVECDLGEGPVWDAAVGVLRWLDVPVARLHGWDLVGDHQVRPLAVVASCVLPTTSGDLVVAGEGAVHRADPDGAITARVADLGLPSDVRTNDGSVDPFGRLWVGSADGDPSGEGGALHRVWADGRVDLLRSGLSMSNGIGFSPDGTRAYHVDTRRRRIDELRLDDAGDIVSTRTFATSVDWPDGLAVDADGGVWVAFWDGGQVRRFSVDGTVDAVVDVPSGFVTSCAFGAPGTTTLHITTAAAGLDADARRRFPDSGALFAVDVGISGVPVPLFGS